MVAKKTYDDRTDIEKIQSQWNKLSGLHGRAEWSAAVVRAATAAEIATNFAIRKEFNNRSNFSDEYVNDLLMWANGISGKFNKLLFPMYKKEKLKNVFKSLEKKSEKINFIRNIVVHRGNFCNQTEAVDTIALTKQYIEELVNIYEGGNFSLTDGGNDEF